MSKVEISLDFTPNPDSLKYSTNQQILAKGAIHFSDSEQAEGKSPLALKLFQVSEIKTVMLGTNFVTVNLSSQENLQDLNETISRLIRDHLESGEPVIDPSAINEKPQKALTEVEQKIQDVLDQEIRPSVAMDGGDIVLEKYEDGFVYLKMQGSCSGCPSSLMTLKMGVEGRLKEVVPEIKEVIPV